MENYICDTGIKNFTTQWQTTITLSKNQGRDCDLQQQYHFNDTKILAVDKVFEKMSCICLTLQLSDCIELSYSTIHTYIEEQFENYS